MFNLNFNWKIPPLSVYYRKLKTSHISCLNLMDVDCKIFCRIEFFFFCPHLCKYFFQWKYFAPSSAILHFWFPKEMRRKPNCFCFGFLNRQMTSCLFISFYRFLFERINYQRFDDWHNLLAVKVSITKTVNMKLSNVNRHSEM
jgi:hypothetical protein